MGDSGCDALQTLYDGSAESNIYSGWRDNMADKAGYLALYLAEGLSVQQACQNINNNNSSEGEIIIPVIPDASGNATDGENADNSTEGEDSGYEIIDEEVIDGGDSGVVVDNSTEGESQEGENL